MKIRADEIEVGDTVTWSIDRVDGVTIVSTCVVREVRIPTNVRGDLIVTLRGVTTDNLHGAPCDGAILSPDWNVEVTR